MQKPVFLSPASGTPLEQIQQAERECAQQCQVAQDRAEAQISAAQQKAAILRRDTLDASRKQTILDHESVITAAHQEGQATIEHAHRQAAILMRDSESVFGVMVSQALEMLIGLGGEEPGHEP